MGSVFSSVVTVVGFIAENIYEFIFPLRGVVVVDSSTIHKDHNLPRRSEEERDASIIHHARYALLHYNSKNPGAEFDLVKPLMVANVLFRRDRWYHISFWARRRGAPPETPVHQFFGELHYRCCTCDVDDDAPAGAHSCDIPVVETCAIVSKISTFQPQPPTRKKKKPRRRACILCPSSFEIFHPKNGKFVCGKEEGHEKEFIRFNNLLEKPFTCTPTIS